MCRGMCRRTFPAPSFDVVFDLHGLDPLSDEDRAVAMDIWLAQSRGPPD